jgi:hypothetical protein
METTKAQSTNRNLKLSNAESFPLQGSLPIKAWQSSIL